MFYLSFGEVLTISFIVGLAPVAIYTAILMSRTSNALAKEQGSRPMSMGEAARATLGEAAARMVYCMVYGYAFLGFQQGL